MADTVNIKIEGIEQLVKKLGQATAAQTLSPAIQAATLHLKGVIAVYPPSSSANSPSRPHWYERGFGPRNQIVAGRGGRPPAGLPGDPYGDGLILTPHRTGTDGMFICVFDR